MNEGTVIANLRAAIAADATLKAWCAANYGQHQWVYEGFDPENPPPQDRYPMVAILPDNRLTGRSRDDEEIGLLLIFGVVDETATESTTSRTVIYRGAANCIAMRRLVLAAADAADLDDGIIVSAAAEYEPLLEFPLFQVWQSLTIRRPYEFRDDRIA